MIVGKLFDFFKGFTRWTAGQRRLSSVFFSDSKTILQNIWLSDSGKNKKIRVCLMYRLSGPFHLQNFVLFQKKREAWSPRLSAFMIIWGLSLHFCEHLLQLILMGLEQCHHSSHQFLIRHFNRLWFCCTVIGRWDISCIWS